MNKIRRFSPPILISGLLGCFSLPLLGQHYPAGNEGIKAGSFPDPGFYVRDYNTFYIYDKVPGFAGQADKGFTQFDYTQSPRLIWISKWKVIDANFGIAARIPFTYQQYTHNVPAVPHPGGFPPPPSPEKTVTDSHFGLSDIQIEPIILSWHLNHFDVSSSYSFWAPTGDFPGGSFNANSTLFYTLGQGYWTHSFSLGLTWYPDDAKTWAVSVLNHYDINTAQYSGLYNGIGGVVVSEDTTLGDIYTLEWGLSKDITHVFTIGLTGYYQQQVTDTEGPTPNGPTWQGEKIHVAGIGPEVDANVPKWGLTAALRYAYEFSAMDHPQGHLVNLTLTKSF